MYVCNTNEGAWPHSATGLNVVHREGALLSLGHAFTPAVVLTTHQVDDVALVERQVIGLGRLVAVQRHHWTQTGSTAVKNRFVWVQDSRRTRTFLQVVRGGVGVIVHWGRKWGHEVIKAPNIFQ